LLSIASGVKVHANSKLIRVFWTGGRDAKKAAEDWARKNGGVTLGKTLKGRVFDNKLAGVIMKRTPNSIKIWEKLSHNYAKKHLVTL
jgi:hypothetical protein